MNFPSIYLIFRTGLSFSSTQLVSRVGLFICLSECVCAFTAMFILTCFCLNSSLWFLMGIYCLYLCSRKLVPPLKNRLQHSSVYFIFACYPELLGRKKKVLFYVNHVWLLMQMGKFKVSWNSKSVASSANLFHSPSDVRHRTDSVWDTISS